MEAVHRIHEPMQANEMPRKKAKLSNFELRKQANKKIHKCDQCHKSFDSENGLKSHIEIVHKTVKIKCQLCEKVFDSEGHKAKHGQEVHQVSLRNLKVLNMIRVDQVKKSIEKKKFFQCDVCLERFDHLQQMTRHKANVHVWNKL